MLIHRLASGIATFSLDSGVQATFPDNPNALEGNDPPETVSRTMQGAIDPLEFLTATRNIMADFRAGTQRILHARYGTVAGNRIGLTVPLAQYLNQTPSDRQGLAAVDVPFEAVGQDAGAFMCFA